MFTYIYIVNTLHFSAVKDILFTCIPTVYAVKFVVLHYTLHYKGNKVTTMTTTTTTTSAAAATTTTLLCCHHCHRYHQTQHKINVSCDYIVI